MGDGGRKLMGTLTKGVSRVVGGSGGDNGGGWKEGRGP